MKRKSKFITDLSAQELKFIGFVFTRINLLKELIRVFTTVK